jgi:hypothetical protein
MATRATAILAGLLAAANVSAFAAEASPDVAALREGVARHILACGAPFAKDLSRARLVEAFGAAHVSDVDVPGAEGEGSTRETLLFADNPAERVRFEWADEKTAKGVAATTISAGSRWLGPGAVHPGSTIQELEKANGKAFTFYGLDWDYGGKVLDWRGGAFQTKPDGCALGIDLTDNPATAAAAQAKVQGEKKFLSDNALARAARPIVFNLVLSF